MEIPEVAKIVADEYLKSGLDIELDAEEMALHLAVTKTRQELVSLDLGDVCHTCIRSGGRAPGITTAEISARGPKTKTLFNIPTRKPTKEEERRMFAILLETLVNVVMSGHWKLNSPVHCLLVKTVQGEDSGSYQGHPRL